MRVLSLLVILLISSVAVRAEDGAADSVLSLQEALLQTYLENPELTAARAEFRAVQEQLPQAQAGFKPTIAAEAGISSTDLSGSNFTGAGGSTEKSVGLSVNQPVFRGGRTVAQIGAARHVIEANLARLIDLEQDVLLRSTTVYLDILRDRALLDLAQNNFKVLAEELIATERRFEFGELTKTDVSQAKARLAEAESEIISARGGISRSEAQFFQLINESPEGIEAPDLDLEMPESLSDAISVAERSSPLIVYARSVYEASKDDIGDVFGGLLPEVNLFSSWNRAFDPIPGLVDESTSRSVGLVASIPLYQGGADRSRLRAAKHVKNQRSLEVVEAKREVRRLVTEEWEDYQTAKSQITSRTAQVEAAAIAEEGTRKEAEFGARTVLDTLDAQQEHLDARVALVTAEHDDLVAQFALLKAMGLLKPRTLGFEGDAQDYGRNLRAIQWKVFDTDVDSVQ